MNHLNLERKLNIRRAASASHFLIECLIKVKQSLYRDWTVPESFTTLREAPRIQALRTGHMYPPGNVSGTHFCQRLSRTQGHMRLQGLKRKNSSETIGNRTRDLPACSAVPQPTAPPHAPCLTF